MVGLFLIFHSDSVLPSRKSYGVCNLIRGDLVIGVQWQLKMKILNTVPQNLKGHTQNWQMAVLVDGDSSPRHGSTVCGDAHSR